MEAHNMVHNANQIALFFSAYPHEEAVAGVTEPFQEILGASHAQADQAIRRPRRRGLHELALEAVKQLG